MGSFGTILRLGALLAVGVIITLLAIFLRKVQEKFQEPIGLSQESIEAIIEEKEEIGFEAGQYEFNRALESIALGELDEAREMLHLIENLYPQSTHAPEARRILGEMNLDEILSVENMSNKKIHRVAAGDGYLRVATRNQTTLDSIMFLNGLTELKDLHVGDELIVMPLDFKLVIDVPKNRVELYHRDRERKEHVFARDYRILLAQPSGIGGGTYQTKVTRKNGEIGEQVFPPTHSRFRHASKVLGMKIGRSLLSLRPIAEEGDEVSAGSIFLKRSDMEELSMLIRVGNEVEYRGS